MKLLRLALAFALLALTVPCLAQAQVVSAVVVASCGTLNASPPAKTQYTMTMDTSGHLCVSTGGGGGGGGPATLAAGSVAAGAYVSGSVLAGAIVDIGTGVSPAANTVNARLATINTTLGSPFQAGGSIGNTTFAVTNAGTFAVQLPTGSVAPASGAAVTLDTTDAANLAGPITACSSAPTCTNDIGRTQGTPLPPIFSAAAESCHVMLAAAGSLHFISGYAGQAEYFMLFNATSAPGDGTVAPVWWGYAGGPGAWGFAPPQPWNMTVGATVCASSTGGFTKTAISTNNVFSGQ